MARKTPRGASASKSRARKRAAVPKKKAPKRRRAPARQRQQRGANDPLFVPHPRALAQEHLERSAAADPYAALIESICGTTDDSQPVEQYRRHARRDGRIRRGASVRGVSGPVERQPRVDLTNPGDVSGVRWGSGTMITNDLFLTCGHLFDQTGGGWERPRVNGTNTIISSQEIARNMRLNFNFQVDAAAIRVRSRVSRSPS